MCTYIMYVYIYILSTGAEMHMLSAKPMWQGMYGKEKEKDNLIE